MEDAMIINKASLERGFAHGSILKSEFVDLQSVSKYCFLMYFDFSLEEVKLNGYFSVVCNETVFSLEEGLM
jgi:hypothetical protein